jgi:PAS domain S-box-containing protein
MTERNFASQATLVSESAMNEITLAQALGGPREVRRVAQGLKTREPLTSAAIVLDSAKTRVMAGGFNLAGPESLYRAGVLARSLPDSESLIIRLPLEWKGKSFGLCYFVFARDQVQADIAAYRASVWNFCAAIFLSGLGLLFLTSTVVLQPLRSLLTVVEGAVKGDLQRRAVVPFKDETDQLATAVNALLLNMDGTSRQVTTLTGLIEKRDAQLEDEADRRKQVEKQVQLSNEIINKVSALILVANSTGGIEYASPSFGHVLGYDPDELLDDGWWKVSRHDLSDRLKERNVVAKYARRELRLSSKTYERKVTDAQGNSRWVLWQDTLGFNNTLIGVGHDITERKLAEEQIREQAALLDITGDAILVRGLDHKVVFWNRGAEILYGIPRAEAMERPADELFEEEGLAAVGLAYSTVIENGGWTGELKQRTKAGKELVVESRWTLMNDDKGSPKSILIVNTDVTEQRQLEVQFRRAQRLENIGTLAGGIAHDLNNVLTPIIMAIQALQKKHTDERTQHMLSTIGLSARRGADIVKQVLTFARGSEGERMLLQPKHILREVEQITRETFPKSLDLRFDLASQLWTIIGDATQLHQIFLNLMVNARDAMPDGGTLTIKAENVVFTEEMARQILNAKPGNYVVLSVSDTGTGIPPAVLEKIFDPFFTTKEVGKGTGLGLSTVMTIVKSYGGFIVVNTGVGKGTEFRVHIPATTIDSGGVKDEGRRTIPAGHGESILVVDDEISIREIIKETLEAFGYRAHTAKDGVEALNIIEQERGRFKMVITDIMMPNMDGASLVRTLERLAPEIKLIVVSGMADQELFDKVKKCRIEALLPKPIHTDNLLRLIHASLHATEAPGASPKHAASPEKRKQAVWGRS